MHRPLNTEKTTCLLLLILSLVRTQDLGPCFMKETTEKRKKKPRWYLQRPNNRNVHWENTHEINNSVQRLRGAHPIRRKLHIADYTYKSVVLFFGIPSYLNILVLIIQACELNLLSLKFSLIVQVTAV